MKKILIFLLSVVLFLFLKTDPALARVAPGVNCVNITGTTQTCSMVSCPAGSYLFCCFTQQDCTTQQNYTSKTPTPVPSSTPSNSDLWCDPPTNTKLNTAIGCIPILTTNKEDFLSFVLKWAVGIGGGIAFLLIVYAGFMIMTSAGNPERLKAGQELLTSAISGLILLIFSVVILKIIGVDILGLCKFGFGTAC